MCIIVAKPQGIEMPSDYILSNCFDSNPDGAGFMFANGKTVYIAKGFMKWEDFSKALKNLGDLTDTSVVMHFRIATHGDVQPSCCHPFPISDDHDKLSARFTESRVAVAHNGVIHGMKTDKNTSDTMAYIADVIAPIRRLSEDFMHNENALDVMEATVGSKLCFLDNSGDIVTIGNFIDDDGVLYSNTSYLNQWGRYSTRNSIWTSSYYDDYYSRTSAKQPALAAATEPEEENIGDLIAQLPYSACADCISNYDCAYDYPQCENSLMAWEWSRALEDEYYGTEDSDAKFALSC